MERLKRFSVISYEMAICILTLFLLLTVADTRAGTELEIRDNNFDFGMVAQNCTVTHRCWFHSVGDDTVTIFDIKTGCGCATAPLQRTQLSPGDSLEVVTSWQTRAARGEVGQTVYVYSNASTNPARYSFSATVIQTPDTTVDVAVLPEKIQISEGSGVQVAHNFTIENRTANDLAIELASPVDDEYSLTFPDTVHANSSVLGTVNVKTQYMDQEFERSFTLRLIRKVNSCYLLTVPIVQGDFSFRPRFTTTE